MMKKMLHQLKISTKTNNINSQMKTVELKLTINEIKNLLVINSRFELAQERIDKL